MKCYDGLSADRRAKKKKKKKKRLHSSTKEAISQQKQGSYLAAAAAATTKKSEEPDVATPRSTRSSLDSLDGFCQPGAKATEEFWDRRRYMSLRRFSAESEKADDVIALPQFSPIALAKIDADATPLAAAIFEPTDDDDENEVRDTATRKRTSLFSNSGLRRFLAVAKKQILLGVRELRGADL